MKRAVSMKVMGLALAVICFAPGARADQHKQESQSKQSEQSALSKFYMEYHDKMLSAKSIDEMLPFLAASRSAKIVSDKKSMPKDQIDFMFSLMKDCCPPKVQVLDEKVDEGAGRAELNLACPNSQSKLDKALSGLSSAKEETKGKVLLVKEDGAWKIDKEEWTSTSVKTDD